MIRRALVLVALVVVVTTGVAHAADALLGATIESAVYVADDPSMLIRNEGSVEATATVEPSGGWSVEPATITLAAGETGTVTVTGDGEDGATLSVTLAATTVPAGMDRGAIDLVAHVFHERPPEPFPWPYVLLAAIVAALVAAGIVRRRWAR